MIPKMKSFLNKKSLSLKTQTKGSFYRKSLTLLLIIVSIPGLITGGIIYWFAVGQIEEELLVLHQSQIENRAANIDDQFSYLELGLSHWALQPRFGYDLKSLNFVYYFKDTRDIYKTLLVMQGSHPLIRSVQLFLNDPKPLLFKPEYTPVKNELLIASYQRFFQKENMVYWTEGLPHPITDTNRITILDVDTDDSILLVHKIPGGLMDPFGVLIVSLNRDKLVNLLQTMTPYIEGTTFLMDSQDKILVSSSNDQMSDIDTVLKNEIAKHDRKSGSFLFEWKGVKYSVSFGGMSRIDSQWTYVSAAPLTSITAPIIWISKLIIMISAAVLFLALILSWFASRRIYTPVERLIKTLSVGDAGGLKKHGMDEFKFFEKHWNKLSDESNSMQKRLEEQRSYIKEGFLLQLIQGHLYFYSEEDLRKRMKQYGWDVDDQKFVILKMQLTGFSNLHERFTSGDEGLVTFAAANIIEELSESKLDQFNVLNFHDLSVGLLVIINPQDLQINQTLKQLCEEVTQAINEIIKMQMTITISNPTLNVKQIPELLMEVNQAASYRNFDDANQIINMQDLKIDHNENKIQYPFPLEREIIQAMRMGHQKETEQLVAQFLEEISTYHEKEVLVQQSMLQLLGSIHHVIMHSGIHPYQLFNGVNMFEELTKIREPQKMLHWLNDNVILPFIQNLAERSNIQMKRIVEKTISHMQQEYMKDISLESCADLSETNPYTLSKAFKQIAGTNFIDYLTELRIEKAKELLRETDLKINDISERVGYQNSYFNRIFKKQEDLTPSQYREKWLKE